MTGEPKKVWGHDELARDLASHLRAGGHCYTWLNLTLDGEYSGQRPDVFAMRPFGYKQPELISYECKVSKADFRSDLTTGKWQGYLKHSQGVTFAAPSGVIDIKDVPAGCGLILRSERAWRHVRRPTLGMPAMTLATMIKLISVRPETCYTAKPYGWSGREDEERQRYQRRAEGLIEASARRKIGKKFGQDIAKFLKSPERAREEIYQAQAQAKQIIEDAWRHRDGEYKAFETQKHQLAIALGLPPATPFYEVKERLRVIRNRIDSAGEVKTIRDAMRKALVALQEIEFREIPKEEQ